MRVLVTHCHSGHFNRIHDSVGKALRTGDCQLSSSFHPGLKMKAIMKLCCETDVIFLSISKEFRKYLASNTHSILSHRHAKTTLNSI
jgi:hypothetical protein